MRTTRSLLGLVLGLGVGLFGQSAQNEARPRARDVGIEVGVLKPGPLNAITDAAGVKVGQTTIIRGDR